MTTVLFWATLLALAACLGAMVGSGLAHWWFHRTKQSHGLRYRR